MFCVFIRVPGNLSSDFQQQSQVTLANHGDREQVSALAEKVQEITGGTVELTYVDQGYTGSNVAEAAHQHGLKLEVAKHPMAKGASLWR